MRLQDYEFSKEVRKDLSLVDFLNDLTKIINNGRYQLRITSTAPDWIGDEGEFLMYVSGTVVRIYFYNKSGATWHHIEWTGSGLGSPVIVGTVSLTGQTSNIASTTIYTPATAGLYRLSVYALTTTAGSAGVLDVSFNWTDDEQAQSSLMIDDLDLAVDKTAGSNSIFIRSTASAIQYSTTITGGSGSPAYSLFIVAEKLL